MKTLNRLTTVTALGAAALLLTSARLSAQDRPNFNPDEMRQRMSDRMKEQFEVTDDAAWKLIYDRIDKVMEARRNVGGGPGMMGFGGRPGGPGGPGGQGGQGGPGGQGNRPAGDNGNNDQARQQRGPGGPGGGGGGFGGPGVPGGPGGFGRPADPDSEALQQAIANNASADQIKALLAKVRDSRKDKEAKLESAQEELRKVLSVRQEALAVTMGLLK